MAKELDLMKYFVIIALTILTSSQEIFITLLKRDEDYNETVVNISVEALMCVLSLVALFKIWKSDGRTKDNKLSMSFEEVMLYSVFAVLCSIHYLLLDSIYTYLDGRTNPPLRILNNIGTVGLCCLFLKRKLARFQLIAFIILCVGGVIAQLDRSFERIIQTSFYGWLMAIVLTIYSSSAEVLKEVIIRDFPSRNINVQNFWLSISGLFVNILAICNHDSIDIIPKGFFYWYSFNSVCLIFNRVLSGIAVLMVLKYADNIVKVYSNSIAMFLTAIALKFLFGFYLSVVSLVCFLFVLGSAIIHGVVSMKMVSKRDFSIFYPYQPEHWQN